MVFSKAFLSLSFSLFSHTLPIPHPVEIKVIKDLPWPPPVGQLDSSESPPDGEAGAPIPLQHSQHSYEDANGGSCMTAACLGGLQMMLAVTLDRCHVLRLALSSARHSPPPLPFPRSSCSLQFSRVGQQVFVLQDLAAAKRHWLFGASLLEAVELLWGIIPWHGRVIAIPFVLSSLPPNSQHFMAAFKVFSATALSI